MDKKLLKNMSKSYQYLKEHGSVNQTHVLKSISLVFRIIHFNGNGEKESEKSVRY